MLGKWLQSRFRATMLRGHYIYAHPSALTYQQSLLTVRLTAAHTLAPRSLDSSLNTRPSVHQSAAPTRQPPCDSTAFTRRPEARGPL